MISGLFTDFYELTMAQGFYSTHKNPDVVYDVFFRKHPFNGGFSILAGLDPLLKKITSLRFSKEDIDFLSKQEIFTQDFLNFLSSWHFSGDIYAFDEGSLIFPQEPVIRVHAHLIDAQIIESLILNYINFQSLIATKTCRIYISSGMGHITEFGLRRAQGTDGAISAARAAYIGGAESTSNTLAASRYGIKTSGTMAHSWVMSFDSEEEAFMQYADLYPANSVFLIDTYDTLKSGITNAIKAGLYLKNKGYNFGVRLDSGDIDYLSRQVRSKLDEAGLTSATISVTNELTEEIINTLCKSGCPVDIWGVGTNLVTGGSESSFSGVYKMCARKEERSQSYRNVMKFSDNPVKTTNPGIKKVYRLYDENGMAKGDAIALEDEELLTNTEYRYFHPMIDYRQFSLKASCIKPLLSKKIEKGIILDTMSDNEAIIRARNLMISELKTLDNSYKRILNPHIYKVSLTQGLKDLKLSLIKDNIK